MSDYRINQEGLRDVLEALADPALTRYHAQVCDSAVKGGEVWRTVGRFESVPAAARVAYRENAGNGARVLDSRTGQFNYVI